MLIVHHKQFGDKNSDESRDAEYIRQVLSNIEADGSILIISNLSLPGGEAVKDIDILIVGYLKDYYIANFSHHANAKINSLKVTSFCITIEHKRHNVDDIDFTQYGGVSVKYGEYEHDVVDQSRKQRDSLRNVLRREKNINPFVTNLIWLRNVEESSVPFDKVGWNVLFREFDADTLFKTAARYNSLKVDRDNENRAVLFSFNESNCFKDLSATLELFLQRTKVSDNLAREKFEYITNRKEKVEFDKTGKLTVIKGRAGTGKTIQLIKFAYQEVVENHKRCLLLTYNHALVSDIKRIATYCDFPDGVDESFCVQTIHSFFIDLMEKNDISAFSPDVDFEDAYKAGLSLLYKQDSIKVPLAWDYLLIDEAQDCINEEIQIWGKIYEEGQIVIADGIDQFVRNISITPWRDIFHPNHIVTKELAVSKRQKANIVSFVNAFADKAELDWNVEENKDLLGGRVIITNRFDKLLFDDLKKKLKDAGNIMYDMLFLVDSTMGSGDYLPRVLNGLHNAGIKVFNGAQYDNKTKYSVDPDESRLYNYNSCRGIEGWTVVCVNIDELVKEKRRFLPYTKKEFESDESYKLRIDREIYKWILMPFTRAIDTLVIVIRDVIAPLVSC